MFSTAGVETFEGVDLYKNVFDAQNVVITINGNVNAQDYINFFSQFIIVSMF